MKIAYVTDQILPQTATDTEQIVNMVSSFGQTGADICLFNPKNIFGKETSTKTISDYYEVKNSFKIKNLKSIFHSIRGLEKAAHGIAASLFKEIKNYDLIYTRNIPIVISALLLSDLPVVYETYRFWPRQYQIMGKLFNTIGANKKFLAAILHSEISASSYRKCGVPENKILVAHNGYSPERLEPVLSKKQARLQLNYPEQANIVCYAGDIGVQKGIDFILDMAEKTPNIIYVLVGSQKRGVIEERADKIENVKIVSRVSYKELLPYLYAADILIIPPVRAPMEKVGRTVLPIKTFLYMASGRAIFAPLRKDLQEILKNEENAILVEPDNLEVCTKTIINLLKNKNILNKLGNTAKNEISNNTWNKRAETIITFLEQRLAGPDFNIT